MIGQLKDSGSGLRPLTLTTSRGPTGPRVSSLFLMVHKIVYTYVHMKIYQLYTSTRILFLSVLCNSHEL